MATHVLRSSDTFPVGTTVGAYPKSNWSQGALPPSGIAPGSATTTAVVQSDGTATFTGLTEDVDYFAGASVSGTWRYVRFHTDVLPNPGDIGFGDPWVSVAPSGATDGTDYNAIQAAITGLAGLGEVRLLPGTWTLNKSGSPALLLPKDASGLRIRGAGVGATTIKLSANTPRAFDFNRTADHDVFQNIELADFTVDCDSVTSTGSTHVIVGNMPVGGFSNRQNFKDITLRRLRAINVPTDYTNTYVRYGVGIAPTQTAAAEVTQNYAKRILVEDVDIYGGNAGVNVIGSRFGSNTAGYNMLLDDILIQRCRHIQPVIYGRGSLSGNGAGDTTVWGASFHVGQNANVGRVTIRDCYSYGIGDVAYEVNNCHTGLVENCVAEEAAGYAFYHTNYEYPDVDAALAGTAPAAVSTGQHLVFRNCTYTRRNSYAYGSAFRCNYNNSVALGRVSFIKCKYERDVAEEVVWKVTDGEAFGTGSGTPMREVFMDGCEVQVANITHTNAADAVTVSFILMQPISTDTFPVPVSLRDTTLDLAGTGTGGGRLQMRCVRFLGNGPLLLQIDGLSYKNTITGLLAADGVGVGLDTAVTLHSGSIRRMRLIKDSTTNGHAIEVGSSVVCAITTKIVVADCDFRFQASAGVNVSATNLPKVRIDDTNADGVSSAVASAGTVTLPSIGSYFTITGTTNITSITASWIGRLVTLNFGGVLTFTDGSNLLLAGNLATTADDTITLRSDGTNWIEVARSVN